MADIIANFKPVGKAVLHRAVGLSDNYALEGSPMSDACKDCPRRKQLEAYSAFPDSDEYRKEYAKCLGCPSGSYLRTAHIERAKKEHGIGTDSPQDAETKTYINEKNRYGYAKRLKRQGILLYLLYHMASPDEFGIVSDIAIKDIARELGCSEKAVRYNNRLLEEYGYIKTSPSIIPGAVHVLLPEYPSYFRKANEGGRGFITLSKDLFHSLKEIRSTNQLRIMLKVMLVTDGKNELHTSFQQSYADLRRFLPGYCKRNVIKKALSGSPSPLMGISLETYTVRFQLNPDHNAKKIKERLRIYNEGVIRREVSAISSTIRTALSQKTIPVFSDHFFAKMQREDAPDAYRELKISDQEIKNMAQLSLEYSTDLVLHALSRIYRSFVCSGENILNLGGLVRNTIQGLLSFNAI